jgi:hypothetical protein
MRLVYEVQDRDLLVLLIAVCRRDRNAVDRQADRRLVNAQDQQRAEISALKPAYAPVFCILVLGIVHCLQLKQLFNNSVWR